MKQIIHMNKMRQFLTILMLTMTLVGVQVVKASPLHDHLSHVAGCILCHGDANEPALTDSGAPHTAIKFALTFIPYGNQPLISRTHTSFHSRAPPLFFT
jgi:hypothetical protein